MIGYIDTQTGILVIEDSVALRNAVLSPSTYDLVKVSLQQKVYNVQEGVLTDGALHEVAVSSVCTTGCDIYYDGADNSKFYIKLPDTFVSGVYQVTVSIRFTGTTTTTQEMGCMALNNKLVCDVLEQPQKADINDLLTFYLLERGQVCDCDCETIAKFYYHLKTKFKDGCDDCQ
ncbi:MAG: hypothetical protein D6698_10375 [Gammaproteobacteria bacterium]|nr:MAG: hypothetical protein D6698_10375 [Gammaproteobacteria bacterium]